VDLRGVGGGEPGEAVLDRRSVIERHDGRVGTPVVRRRAGRRGLYPLPAAMRDCTSWNEKAIDVRRIGRPDGVRRGTWKSRKYSGTFPMAMTRSRRSPRA
jgi:hypothetical protein